MSSTPPTIDYATPGTKPPRRWGRLIGWVLFFGLAILFFLLMRQNPSSITIVSLDTFANHLEGGNIAAVNVRSDELVCSLVSLTPVPGTNTSIREFRVKLPPSMGDDWEFINWLLEHRKGASINYDWQESVVVNLLLPLIPWLLIFGFVWFFVFRLSRSRKPISVVIVNPESLK